MKKNPKKKHEGPIQSKMLKVFLKDIVLIRYLLEQLVDRVRVDWRVFEDNLNLTFCNDNGRLRLPVWIKP